jgi:hypothetical protein
MTPPEPKDIFTPCQIYTNILKNLQEHVSSATAVHRKMSRRNRFMLDSEDIILSSRILEKTEMPTETQAEKCMGGENMNPDQA